MSRHSSVRIDMKEAFDAAFAMIEAGDYKNAESVLHQLLNVRPNAGNGLYYLAIVALQTNRRGMGIALLREASRVLKDQPYVWMTLGCALTECGMTDEAIKAHNEAARLEPGNAQHWANLSGTLVNLGRYDEVIRYARKALTIDPNNVDAQWQMALGHLEKGIFSPEVWRWHEARRRILSKNTKVREYPGDPPDWAGQPTSAGVVFHGEQGLGDEVMFASCLPDALRLADNAIVECAPRLETLFRRSFPAARVIGTHDLKGEQWPDGFTAAHKLPFGSLPSLFRPTREHFDGRPYLVTDPAKVAAARARLPESGRVRVGLSWQGGSQSTRVDLRSFPPWSLRPITEQDADFVSLQYTRQAEADAKMIGVHHWPDLAEADDMDDVASLVASCDLVISVCTTVIHIAGALGVPCWVLVPSRHAWRYGGRGVDMPWYKSVRLFRQLGNDWDTIIRKVANELGHYRGLSAAQRASARYAA